LRDAVAMQTRLSPRDTDDRLAYGRQLCQSLLAARHLEEALGFDRMLEAVARERDEKATVAARPGRRLGGQPGDELQGLARAVIRAQLLALGGDGEAAARLANEAAERAGSKHADLRAQAWIAAALSARLQARPADALALAKRALEDPQYASFGLKTKADAAAAAGNAWLDLGDYALAEPSLLQARALFERGQVEPSVRMADALIGLARVHLHAGRNAQAETLLLPLVTAWAKTNPGSAWHGEALHWLARAEATQGKAELALSHRNAAAAMLHVSALPAHRRLASAGAGTGIGTESGS
jgi:tetratricopeptide (TPR) repeat protein